MTIQVFGHGSRFSGATINLPRAYRRPVRWVPRIGDAFPDFTAPSTHGTLRFHEWAAGRWVYLFSHPAAFTPVCTTELAAVAERAAEFRGRGVAVLNISRDGVQEQRDWCDDIGAIFGARPEFPLVSDPQGTITDACGMIHPSEDGIMAIRKAFVLDPAGRIRMIFEYPMAVGRSVNETLRVIDALKATEGDCLAAPADWRSGDPLLVRSAVSDFAAQRRFGAKLRRLRHYLRFVLS